MNIMQTYPVNLIGGSGKHYLLLNTRGRLSECTCCCPIDRLLYLHVEPVFGDQNCEENDQGPQAGGFQLTQHFGFQNCDHWDTDVKNAPPLLSPNGMLCWNGGPHPQGESGQVYELGVGMTLSCSPVNQWRIDLCFSANNHPTWPLLDIDEELGVCNELYKGMSPIAINACEAEPGEFLIDFGNITPLGGTQEDSPHGDALRKVYAGTACLCQFHIYIDEHLDPSQAEQNNLYFYPAEAANAMNQYGLEEMIWFNETMPTIGTPLHPSRPPSTFVPPRQRPVDDFPEDLFKQLEDL